MGLSYSPTGLVVLRTAPSSVRGLGDRVGAAHRRARDSTRHRHRRCDHRRGRLGGIGPRTTALTIVFAVMAAGGCGRAPRALAPLPTWIRLCPVFTSRPRHSRPRHGRSASGSHDDERLSLTGSSGVPPPRRTRSRAATGTTTGGRSSTRPGTPCERAVSGDACDHFYALPRRHRRCSRDLGFGAYRFSIEWSRIEPEDGEFSIARARPLPAHARRVPRPRPAAGRDVPPLHDAALGRGRRAAGSSAGIVDRALRPLLRARRRRTSATEIGIGCTINEPNVVSLMGYLLGAFPPGRETTSTRTPREREPDAPRTGAAYDAIKAGRGDFPVGLRRDGRLVVARGPRRLLERTAAHARGRSTSRRRAATTSSASRRTRAPGSTSRAAARPRSGRRDAARWATSSGRRRSRSRSATPADGHRRARSTSPRTASAPTTTRSGSRYVARGARRRRPLPRRRRRRARLLLLVAARQLRVGVRLPDALRSRRRRPRDPGAHAQAERARSARIVRANALV